MSRCSIGININMKGGKKISHKFFAADQLKEFVLTCDVNEVKKAMLRKLRGGAIDKWVMDNLDSILPQYYATQRETSKGKKSEPRMMSWSKYHEDE